MDGGPWAGTIFNTELGEITKSVTKAKWEKAQNYLLELRKKINDGEIRFEYKWLEKIRGFMCHLAMTYDIIFPYLKGFHLTLAQHLPKRDDEWWKMTDLHWAGYVENKFDNKLISEEQKEQLLDNFQTPNPKPPKYVELLPRFHSCLEALETLFSSENPPIVKVRSKQVYLAVYGFLDESGTGFGSTIESQGEVKFRMGIWGRDDCDNSSNWKEFENLVSTLEDELHTGSLKGALLILAVDNSTVENCIYKGNSSSEKLFDLILRFKDLEIKSGAKFLVSHVSGERIKSQGTDGISRGSLQEGISMDGQMLAFCPWHLSAFQQNEQLRDWIQSWVGETAEFLEPRDWFQRGHDIKGGKKNQRGFWQPNIQSGTFVWSPPPAAAHFCLEELRKARIKRQVSTHILLIPKLLTPLWRKQFHKSVDFYFEIKPHHPFWSALQFEPLWVGICFPYAKCAPWQIRRTPKLLQMARTLPGLLEKDYMVGRNILREFLVVCRRLPTMSESMVRKLLYFGKNPRVPCHQSKAATTTERPSKKRQASGVMAESASRRRRL